MVGSTLTDLRSQIESRATDDGRYAVVCGRTAERFVPLGERRFPDRETAAEAARLAEQYRAALRRYDPQVPCYDPIVCEVPADVRTPPESGPTGPTRVRPPSSESGSPTERIEFCHHVVGAVFEALSTAGRDAVERAVMDAYFEAAETVGSRDTLCLRLLEEMAVELDARLSPADQRAVLAEAATQLPASAPKSPGLSAAFDRLSALDFFEEYTLSPSNDRSPPSGAYRVSLSRYALSPTDAALPTLPITVDLLRRRPDATPAVSDAVRLDEHTWRLTLTTATRTPAGLTTAPIRSPDDGETTTH